MKKILFAAVVAMALSLTASPAFALVLDFGSDTTSLSYGMDFDFGDLHVYTFGVSWNGENWVERKVHQNENGLGVTFYNDEASDGQRFRIDGMGQDEALVFAFDKEVTLDAAVFRGIEGYDEFALYVDPTDPDGLGDPDFEDFIPFGFPHRYNFLSGDTTGQVFAFTVTDCNDDYKVRKLIVTPSEQVTPEPASMVLLGIGLAGLARLRRRK